MAGSIILLPFLLWLLCPVFLPLKFPAVLSDDGAQLAIVDVVVVDVRVETFEVRCSLDRGFVASGDEAHYLELALPTFLKLPADEPAESVERLFGEEVEGAPLGSGDDLAGGGLG